MKNTIFITIILFLCYILSTYSQSNYSYYYKGQKVYLTLDKTRLNIFANENFHKTSISDFNFKNCTIAKNGSINQNEIIGEIEFQSEPTDLEFFKKIEALKQNSNINHVTFLFKRINSTPIGISNIFYIKLKNANDYSILERIANQLNVSIISQVPFMPEWYILALKKKSKETTLDLTNYFFETGLFADVDPAFMFNFNNSCANDTNFGSLWGLQNSANPTIDINACQAWNISQGSGIKVAVVDQGIQTAHLDLAANILPSSFNAQTGTSPSVFSNQSHGTHVAGTIAARKDNNLQVVGVAPLSKIMAVSHSLTLTQNISAELASGISWSYLNNADVINNSWGDQGGQFNNQLRSSILENAILNAMTLGRNNKGTVVVFASGNFAVNSPIMDYPATFNDQIITVGSITNVGQRSIFSSSTGSGYGSKLDIVAPGSNILSTVPNNQVASNNGTSMAAPHVSGVCALILSKNPCLTGQQVRDIIEKTSQKVGGYSYTTTAGRANGTWNNQMGYGLVDAFAAVQMAQSLSLSAQISGLNTLCSTATYSAITSGATSYNWTITQGSNLVTLSGNGTSTVNLTALPNTLGLVTLSLTVGGTCEPVTVTKSIQVGGSIVTNPGVVIGQSPLSSNETSAFSYSGGANASSYRWFIYGGINDGVGPEGGAYITSYQLGGRLANIDTGSIASNLVIAVEAVSECNVVIDTAFMFVEVTNPMARFAAASTSSIITTFPNPLTASNELQVNVVQTKDTRTSTTTATKVSAKTIDNQVKIYDLQGNLKYSSSFKTDNMSIKNLDLKQGNYILNVNTSAGEQLSKAHKTMSYLAPVYYL